MFTRSHLSAYLLHQVLTENPAMSQAERWQRQSRQLRHLVQHAYDNVAYYRRLFDQHGLKPADIRDLSDISLIPITTRKTLQQQPLSEIVARGIKPEQLLYKTTGGSTGRPLVIRRSWLEERILNLFRRRVMREYGLHRQDKMAILMQITNVKSNNRLLEWFSDTAKYYQFLPINFGLPHSTIVSQLCTYKPDILAGAAGQLANLARNISESERQQINLRFIVCGAEVLTPLMRKQLESVFNAPVYDMYGSHEFNLLAWECPQTHQYHICDSNIILEVLNNGQAVDVGERGEVIGTNLYAYAMPFIRFQLTDMVIKGEEQCRCGRPLATLKKLSGRMSDYFILPDKRSIYYAELIPILHRIMTWVQAYQITQETMDRFVLRLETARQPTETEMQTAIAKLKDLFGAQATIEIKLVTELQFEKNGKFRIFRSLINSNYNEET